MTTTINQQWIWPPAASSLPKNATQPLGGAGPVRRGDTVVLDWLPRGSEANVSFTCATSDRNSPYTWSPIQLESPDNHILYLDLESATCWFDFGPQANFSDTPYPWTLDGKTVNFTYSITQAEQPRIWEEGGPIASTTMRYNYPTATSASMRYNYPTATSSSMTSTMAESPTDEAVPFDFGLSSTAERSLKTKLGVALGLMALCVVLVHST